VSAVLVIPFGPALYLLAPGEERPHAFRLSTAVPHPRPGANLSPDGVPAPLADALAKLPPGVEVHAGGPPVLRALALRTGRRILPASLSEWRRVRRSLPRMAAATERVYLREVASSDLARALRSPEEVLITLTREEERLERAVGREQRAAEAMITVPGSPLVDYVSRWASTRAGLERHHHALVETMEGAARELVPNLATIVGPRVAARMVAAAGGVAPLGRMSGARIQLLGSRRRPSPERGPRFGVIFRAERMGDVPVDRRGAYARSLASLAAIAVRADATTRATIAPILVRRRDRRIDDLRRRSR
jgi:snoRNA binding domain-containing protein (fibrillarin)